MEPTISTQSDVTKMGLNTHGPQTESNRGKILAELQDILRRRPDDFLVTLIQSLRANKQPEFNADEQPAEPSTTIPYLDVLIDESSAAARAMAYVCFEITRCKPELSQRIIAKLNTGLEDYRNSEAPSSMDLECEWLPVYRLLVFLNGWVANRVNSNG